MQELRLVAVSEDGTYAVLAAPGQGGRFALPIDDRLRIVARGQFSRLAQYEIEVERPLRPKEIQDRIRAGETAEEIAEAAGVPIDRVRRFEGPVLAERAHWALQAQDATIRLPGDSGPGRRLGDVVAERLSQLAADPESAEWDSRKRSDGTWQVQLTFTSGGYPRMAEWQFDPRRRHVAPDDDTAAGLCLPDAPLPSPRPLGTATVTPIGARLAAVTGAEPAAPHRAEPAATPASSRTSAAEPGSGRAGRAGGQLPSAPFAPAAGPQTPAPQDPRPRTPAADVPAPQSPAARVPSAPAQVPPGAVPAPRVQTVPEQAPAAATPAAATPAAGPTPAAPAPAAPAPAAAAAATPAAAAAGTQPADTRSAPARERPARKAAGGRSRRSSVPSWDEIMFGTSRQSDEA